MRRATGIGQDGDVDWSTPGGPKVYEKLDGYPAVLYHYEGEWMVLIAKCPPAAEVSLENLFWKLWKEQGILFSYLIHICFLFTFLFLFLYLFTFFILF